MKCNSFHEWAQTPHPLKIHKGCGTLSRNWVANYVVIYSANPCIQFNSKRVRHPPFNKRENPHIDYGYAVTSHSSQGQTADRVLIHIDTEQGGEKLVNRRLAYVAVSRGRYDAQIYTNDKTSLAQGLGRDVSHRSAMEPSRESSSSAHKIEPSSARSQVNEHRQAQGHSISG